MLEVDATPCPGLRVLPSVIMTRYKQSQQKVEGRSVRGSVPPVDHWEVPTQLKLGSSMTFREALDGTTFYDTWIGAWNAGNVKCAYHKMFMSWATRRRSEEQAQQGAQQRQQPRNAESGSSASSPAVPLCTICAVASVDSIYVSCGHACVCRDCAAISAARADGDAPCPMCRTRGPTRTFFLP